MFVLLQVNPTINLFLYEKKNVNNYKIYTELLDLNTLTSEPTEIKPTTDCPCLLPTINNTYIPTINNTYISNTNQNTCSNEIVIIISITISSFIIIIFIIIYFKYKIYKKNKHRNHLRFILDDNFGVGIDDVDNKFTDYYV